MEIELSEHRKADHDYQTTVATVLSVARRAKTIFENNSEVTGKRAFLNYILQNPTIDGKKLYFTIASPFNLVLDFANTLSGSPGRDMSTFIDPYRISAGFRDFETSFKI